MQLVYRKNRAHIPCYNSKLQLVVIDFPVRLAARQPAQPPLSLSIDI